MKTITDEKLVDAARAACKQAYARYSNLRVGAAIASPDGVITGCNVENASYGLTICAERVAVFTAVAAGCAAIDRIAIAVEHSSVDVTSSSMPCGACLQVLAEFMPADGEVLIAGSGKFKLRDLLPRAFSLSGNSVNLPV